MCNTLEQRRRQRRGRTNQQAGEDRSNESRSVAISREALAVKIIEIAVAVNNPTKCPSQVQHEQFSSAVSLLARSTSLTHAYSSESETTSARSESFNQWRAARLVRTHFKAD